MEPAVACSQNRSVVTGELGGDTESWRQNVPCIERSAAFEDVTGLITLGIDAGNIVTDGAAVVEPDSGIDRQPLSDRYCVGYKQGRGFEETAIVGRGAGDGLKGLPVDVVEIPGPGRYDDRLPVLAMLDFHGHLPGAVSTEQSGLVLVGRRFACCTDVRQSSGRAWTAAVDVRIAVGVLRRREAPAARIVLACIHEASGSDVPRCVGRYRVGEMAECHGGNVRMQP